MTNRSSTEQKTDVCAECRMPKSEWQGNEGRGVEKQGKYYCCDGCAEGTGCACENFVDED